MSATGKLRGNAPGKRSRQARSGGASASSGRTAASNAGATVIMQARVDADFAAELLERDAPTLGLEGISALVREGLRLLHKRAREIAAAAELRDFRPLLMSSLVNP